MSEVPRLLVDNGSYTSLADLTLRKIRALEKLTGAERDRLMSETEYKTAKEQCYSIILSLFAAIELSISKDDSANSLLNKEEQDYISYFLSKLN